MDKKKLSETDIISKYIMPAVQKAGWNLMTQIRQEVSNNRVLIWLIQKGNRKLLKKQKIRWHNLNLRRQLA